MLETRQVNGHMLVIMSVVGNQWGYPIVTLSLPLGRQVSCTMVSRSLTRAEAIEAAINTLTNLGAI